MFVDKNKFNKVILFLILSIFPFQFGLHLWPSWAYLFGFRIDYLSPTVYLTEVLLVVYLLSHYLEILQTLKRKQTLAVLFILFSLLNSYYSLSPPAALIAWLKTTIYLLVFIILRREKNLANKVYLPLKISTVVVILIEFAQLIKQSSLGGILYYLGERDIGLAIPNVAKTVISIFDTTTLILRPYSTFSHPNSLAGYLLIVIVILNTIKKLPLWLNLLIVTAIVFTFSKAAILVLLLLIPFITISKNSIFLPWFVKTIFVVSLVISFLPVLLYSYSYRFDFSSSVLSRLYLGPPTANIIRHNPIIGTGLNNYLYALKNELEPSQTFIYTLQPVHSLPLLIISEIGIVAFILLLRYIIRRGSGIPTNLYTYSFLVIQVTGSIDHYWWTLIQNKLILILVFALISSNEIRKINSKY